MALAGSAHPTIKAAELAQWTDEIKRGLNDPTRKTLIVAPVVFRALARAKIDEKEIENVGTILGKNWETHAQRRMVANLLLRPPLSAKMYESWNGVPEVPQDVLRAAMLPTSAPRRTTRF
jgi:hypothetical protein